MLLPQDLMRLQTEQRKVLRMMLQISTKVVDGAGSAEEESEPESVDVDLLADDTIQESDEKEEEEEEVLLEDWVLWVKRATHIQKAQVTDWVREQRKRYWDLAGRLARCSDSRWSHVIIDWIPQAGGRNIGAPTKTLER